MKIECKNSNITEVLPQDSIKENATESQSQSTEKTNEFITKKWPFPDDVLGIITKFLCAKEKFKNLARVDKAAHTQTLANLTESDMGELVRYRIDLIPKNFFGRYDWILEHIGRNPSLCLKTIGFNSEQSKTIAKEAIAQLIFHEHPKNITEQSDAIHTFAKKNLPEKDSEITTLDTLGEVLHPLFNKENFYRMPGQKEAILKCYPNFEDYFKDVQIDVPSLYSQKLDISYKQLCSYLRDVQDEKVKPQDFAYIALLSIPMIALQYLNSGIKKPDGGLAVLCHPKNLRIVAEAVKTHPDYIFYADKALETHPQFENLAIEATKTSKDYWNTAIEN